MLSQDMKQTGVSQISEKEGAESMSQDELRDVAIIGAGPVGLFTIFECGMVKLSCHVIDTLPMPGGQCAALYPEKPIFDIPAWPEITAGALIEQLQKQAAPFAPLYHLDQQVETITQEGAEAIWHLKTSLGQDLRARALIIAAGVGAFGPNRPPLAGIEAYEGKSVFYHVHRREAFRGKRIVIAGGGDSAVDWALSLAPLAEKIYFVHRRAKFRAAPENVARLEALAKAKDSNVAIIVPYQLSRLEGAEGELHAVIIETLEGEIMRLDADILLPFFGLSMNLGPIAEWGLQLDHQHIAVDPVSMSTNQPGIFAIGDIARYPGKLKLILTGFAEAALAAHSARAYLHPGEAFHFEYSTSTGVPSTG